MRALLGLLVVCLSLTASAAPPAPKAKPKPVTCPSPAGGKPRPVSLGQVQAAAKAAERAVRQKGVHVIDLTDDGRAARRKLDVALEAGDLCAALEHARLVSADAQALKVDSAFVAAKVERVREWAKASADPAASAEALRVVDLAAAEGAKKPGGANQRLNRALRLVLDVDDPWRMPKPASKEPEPAQAPGTARTAAELRDDEVIAGCPLVGKRGAASSQELEDILARLKAGMTAKKVRLTDLSAGVDLGSELAKHVAAQESWPAARIACALLKRVAEAEVNLALIMARFSALNRVRDARGLPEAAKARFSELVRKASDELAQREFVHAHATLEELFILLGEPLRAGDTLLP